jgi:hypothetical protein
MIGDNSILEAYNNFWILCSLGTINKRIGEPSYLIRSEGIGQAWKMP